MSTAIKKLQDHIQSFNFEKIFIQELGWDKFNHRETILNFENFSLKFQGVAEKRGFAVVKCVLPAKFPLQDKDVRFKIEKEVTKLFHEHLLILCDSTEGTQFWLWTKKERGASLKIREVKANSFGTNQAIAEKLYGLTINLSEEQNLNLNKISNRVQQNFDVEKVTKVFFDRFQKEHTAFLKFIKGIQSVAHREWYASLMLNRLMFVYFIQKRGFLDNDINYLRNRLERLPSLFGKNKFHSFYRSFLIKLFHEGLGASKRTPELEFIIGKVPYFNGGLFEIHEIEKDYDITIEDEAFDKIFKFFDSYSWHLNDTGMSSDKSINPDVIGYIFEKYINQKDLGAYYTKEDITDYISISTIAIQLIENTILSCKKNDVAIDWIWSELRRNPEKYIHDEVKKDISRKFDLGAKSNSFIQDFGLSKETFDELIRRKERYESLIKDIKSKEVFSCNDLVAWNVDIQSFLTDIITKSDSADFISILWTEMNSLKILDPTCGSGAFLFAALRTLEDHYQACINKMHDFLFDESYENFILKNKDLASNFSRVLAEVGRHPSRRYFVLKKIVLGNLFGVDVMKEAVEICKLRLFLELVAHVNSYDEIEPLPDLDFNIRSGNALVGYRSFQEVKDSLSQDKYGQLRILSETENKMLIDAEEDAEVVARAMATFRYMQEQYGINSELFHKEKLTLSKQINNVRKKITKILYNSNKSYRQYEFENWFESHNPFHWIIDFYGILNDGGFDVIIGNPPYKQNSEIKNYKFDHFLTAECGNIYAVIMERCFQLGKENSSVGVIVPVSSISTDGYSSLQALLKSRISFLSSFNDRPSKLFDGLEHIRLTIHLLFSRENVTPEVYTTGYKKWFSEERDHLFKTISYVKNDVKFFENSIPKLQSKVELGITKKLFAQKKRLNSFMIKQSNFSIKYTRKVGHFLQIQDFVPTIIDSKGRVRPPSEIKEIFFPTDVQSKVALAVLNSSLFFWFYSISSDCRNLNRREIDNFLIDLELLANSTSGVNLVKLVNALMIDFQKNSEMRTSNYKQHGKMTIQCIFPRKSKQIIDDIDRELGLFLGLTQDEIEFIINFDIKFRLGVSDDEKEY